LARNSDLDGLIDTIRAVEDRFNRDYHYDWVFLNEEPFSNEFKRITTNLISGTAKYGVIPREHWSYPDYIDQDLARENRQKMKQEGIIYGGSESYRHMCRFESGFFFKHPLMLDYRYYWRVEPDTKLSCNIDYDVFKFMSEKKKTYGFTITLYEYEATIKTLWQTTKDFIKENPQYIAEDNLAEFMSHDNLETFNLCHYWSNFEIADMDFWRGEAYQKYFKTLDESGGFFYERWGDAPVHSIAASLFLDRKQVHLFDDIGYTHPPYTHCPANYIDRGLSCTCKESDSFDWDGYSCMRQYYAARGWKAPPQE
jgi:alpha 1,2-mannosyltransferase